MEAGVFYMSFMPLSPKRNGYTLLEMSVVLTIIGLIVGGILIGRNIIHNGELHSAIADLERYKKAALLFKDKYHEFPGDMPNAENFWGTDANCANQLIGANATPKIPTCNGNGNGMIGDYSDIPYQPTVYAETYRFWQQLANAGMIDGTYNGAISSRVSPAIPFDGGMNIPAGQIGGTGFLMTYAALVQGGAGGNQYFDGVYNHILIFFRPNREPVSPMEKSYPAVSAVDGHAIDQKMDDGFPGTGNIRTFGIEINPTCPTSMDPLTARYSNNTDDSPQCTIIYVTGY